MEMAIVMARDVGMDWILQLDTDELIHPAGAREYSLRQLLLDVPGNVNMAIFLNYVSRIYRRSYDIWTSSYSFLTIKFKISIIHTVLVVFLLRFMPLVQSFRFITRSGALVCCTLEWTIARRLSCCDGKHLWLG